ncbi:hypothetical protein GCM10009795_038030 [Nocardioides hankookensis]|uniref:Uncharacterized protein n=1 Tax=Nocardioides hankookensis TaxID=443157 RepID=A0ABW1LRZ4_9ACTN
MRGIFFGEDDASAVVARLRSAGYEARVERERLAGEDDDEDHPWAVLTDAPELVLELLVEEYDGWLDAEQDEGARRSHPQSPLDLPTQPRRIKRPS